MLDHSVWKNFVRMARDDSRPKKKKRKKRGLSQDELFEKGDWREFTISNYDNATGL